MDLLLDAVETADVGEHDSFGFGMQQPHDFRVVGVVIGVLRHFAQVALAGCVEPNHFRIELGTERTVLERRIGRHCGAICRAPVFELTGQAVCLRFQDQRFAVAARQPLERARRLVERKVGTSQLTSFRFGKLGTIQLELGEQLTHEIRVVAFEGRAEHHERELAIAR